MDERDSFSSLFYFYIICQEGDKVMYEQINEFQERQQLIQQALDYLLLGGMQ